MTVGYDCRLFAFCILLIIGFYAATRGNYFRFVLINFRGDVNTKRTVASENAADSKPPCSFSVLRNYLRATRSNYLPGDGVWKRRGGRLDRFHPDLCSLTYGSWVPRDRLARCFTSLNVSYVVILGDSNALRLYKEIRRALSAAGALRSLTCQDIHHDADIVRPALPARQCFLSYLAISRFLPPTYFRCNITDVHLPVASLTVQYLPVTADLFPLNALLNSTTTGCVDSKTGKFVHTQATTLQDFLFGEYFSTSPHPDIVLYFSNSWEQNALPVYAKIVDQFVKRLRQHKSQLSASTRLIVISRPDEYVPLKPDIWRRRLYQPGNVTRNEWIEASNHILHAQLAPLFADEEFEYGPQLLLFPDIAAAMRPVLDELAVDGVHSSRFWYKTLWSYITQTICSGYM